MNTPKPLIEESISDHQQSCGYDVDPSMEPWRHALPVIADFNSIHKPLVLYSFISISRYHPAMVEAFQFYPVEPVAYEGSYCLCLCGLVAIFSGLSG